MTHSELPVPGAFVMDVDRLDDERGYYARCWRSAEFASLGLPTQWAQVNLLHTRKSGTLRGLHWQVAPHDEAKLVLCTRGSIFDVIVDTRPGSVTFGGWAGVEISSADHRMVYVPHGCAHGLLTLTDDSEVIYASTGAYHPESERGMRYDDPVVAVEWPTDISVVSARDRSWPGLVRQS